MTAWSTVRHVVAGALPVTLRYDLRRRYRYRRNFGRHLALGRPDGFNDKVNWRILHDRRALLEGTCDKLAMKEHAEHRAADLVRVPRTHWVGTDVAELAGVDLPGAWVLKPNHSTALVHLGRGRPDTAELARATRGWLEDDHYVRSGQPAYRSARRALLVEEHIGTPGTVPADLKVFVFDGVPRLVQVHTGRGEVHACRSYTPGWEPLAWWAGFPLGPEVPRPQRLTEMLRAASVLAEGFDMLRVDFYEHDGVLWFGELTPYPGGGMVAVDAGLDAQMGRWWALPRRTRGGEHLLATSGSSEHPGASPLAAA